MPAVAIPQGMRSDASRGTRGRGTATSVPRLRRCPMVAIRHERLRGPRATRNACRRSVVGPAAGRARRGARRWHRTMRTGRPLARPTRTARGSLRGRERHQLREPAKAVKSPKPSKVDATTRPEGEPLREGSEPRRRSCVRTKRGARRWQRHHQRQRGQSQEIEAQAHARHAPLHELVCDGKPAVAARHKVVRQVRGPAGGGATMTGHGAQ